MHTFCINLNRHCAHPRMYAKLVCIKSADAHFVHTLYADIRWIPPKASCLPSSVLVVTFCVTLVKGEDELVSGFRGPALIRFCDLQCQRRFGMSVCSLSTITIALLSDFNVWNERWSSDAPFSSDFEYLQGTEVLLLRDQEDHKLEAHKSSNCSSCSYLLLHIVLI